jgi:hypothetical protein
MVRVVGAGWVLAAFPLHLPFEVLGGLAGEPAEWRSLGQRVGWLGVGAALLLAVKDSPCRHVRPVTQLPRWGRISVSVEAVVPVIGWTLPHLAWFAGNPLGITRTTLDQARELGPALGLPITILPVLTSVLTLGLNRRWGQVWPSWVPRRAGRSVPRLFPGMTAATVGLALAAYGVIGLSLMGADLARGTTSWSELRDAWAVASTEIVFLVWGVGLVLGATAYLRSTRCDVCHRPAVPTMAVEPDPAPQ